MKLEQMYKEKKIPLNYYIKHIQWREGLLMFVYIQYIIYFNALFGTVNVALNVNNLIYLNMSLWMLTFIRNLSTGIKFSNRDIDVILRDMQKTNYESE